MRGSYNKASFASLVGIALCGFAAWVVAEPEKPGEFEGVKWERNQAEDGFDFSWTGKPERYYFIEQSSNLKPGSWFYFPFAVKGQGDSTGIFLSRGENRSFFRLRYADSRDSMLLASDYSRDGFSNQDLLDIGANPFDSVDSSGNGIPDAVEAFWAQVPAAWKLMIVNDPQSHFYDPDGLISSIEGVLPGDDYDGDGRSNLREYLDGTDPTDYFNGEPAFLYIHSGDGQTAGPSSYLDAKICVRVIKADGSEYLNAPVQFETVGHHGLSIYQDEGALGPKVVLRTQSSGACVEYFTPTSLGESSITATLPNSSAVSITVHTVESASANQPPIRNFKKKENTDGTVTYTWTSDAGEGDWFQIEERRADGGWEPIYQTVYGSSALPYLAESTDYSLTLDENLQPVF